MAVFIFHFSSEEIQNKLDLANAEMIRIATARDTEVDGSMASSVDDGGHPFIQVEGSPTLLRCIAMVTSATDQEKSDLEAMLASL